MPKKKDPWFVVVERNIVKSTPHLKKKWKWTPLPDYAVGPFSNEKEAEEECNSESSMTFCLLTIDAKNEGYVADECYYTQSLTDNAIIIAPFVEQDQEKKEQQNA